VNRLEMLELSNHVLDRRDDSHEERIEMSAKSGVVDDVPGSGIVVYEGALGRILEIDVNPDVAARESPFVFVRGQVASRILFGRLKRRARDEASVRMRRVGVATLICSSVRSFQGEAGRAGALDH
jgi:hypothetical protein